MKKRTLSPLGRWLKSSGVRQGDFADTMTRSRGAKTRQGQVSNWSVEGVDPTDAIIVAIERATRGAVKREQWPIWRLRNGKKRAARAVA